MRIREQRMRLASLEDELRARMDTALTQRKHQMMVYIERMRGLSPLEKLAQGYAAASNVRGERIFSIEQVEDGDVLDLYVSDGKICAAVQGKEALTR
jgi:exodeoxyribonuclease VII large subunit